jgi:peptide/nickel transport system ATP-binding protein
VDAIFHNPKHPYTQALLRSIPSAQKTTKVKLPTISGSIPHPFNKPKGCPFHPRCIHAIKGKCNINLPSEFVVGDQQFVSCYLYGENEEIAR